MKLDAIPEMGYVCADILIFLLRSGARITNALPKGSSNVCSGRTSG